jgi:hypothetical protein
MAHRWRYNPSGGPSMGSAPIGVIQLLLGYV